ncbi:DUF4270 family protein [Segetibacter koreensis]|uniref:DUF4270 family protein n=1 Tax=Segetibacter koreensis TaxID=398037 RepID=UPI0003685381|nr:DUF4270 family protein [Segetibacter koreensis]
MRKLSWIAIAVLFCIFSCTKIDTTNIGSGLIPPIDGVTTLDTTLDVISTDFINPTNDSLKVYKSDDHVIGVINNDPLFGKTLAQTFFELKPTSYKFSFPGGASVIPDSAVLILSYKGSFGDTTVPQTWEVRELTESLKKDSAYPVSRQFATGNILGSKTVDITTFNDSVKYGLENASNQIRIKLSGELANRLIKQYDSTAGNAYENDSLFRLNFKGFAVGPAAGSAGNALIRVNLLDSNTKLALFYNYKIPDSANRSTAVSYFRFSTGNISTIPVSASSNYIRRNYNGSQLAANLSDNDNNDSVLFIQTSPGSFATIKIPGLSSLQNSIIHRAELAVYQAPDVSASDMFAPPRYLLLSGYDSISKQKINIPNDFVVNSTSGANISQFGGYVIQKNIPDFGTVNGYVFDVSRYVQGIVTRKEPNLTLRLSAPSNDSLKYTAPYPATTASSYYLMPSIANNVAIGRILLAGGGMKASPLRMRLRIIFSKI